MQGGKILELLTKFTITATVATGNLPGSCLTRAFSDGRLSHFDGTQSIKPAVRTAVVSKAEETVALALSSPKSVRCSLRAC